MKILITLLALSISVSLATVIPEFGLPSHTGLQVGPQRTKLLEVTNNDRKNCVNGEPVGDQPNTRINTSQRVSTLIEGMKGRSYNAYIVPTADAHQSEYVAKADQRRLYISGFSGSAGTAVILSDGQRALWTDGRYFLQADDQLDCKWILMRDSMEGVPTISEWLLSELKAGDVVSADARLIGADTWLNLEATLSANGISLVVDKLEDGNDLLDLQWNQDGRPSYSLAPIFHLEYKFSGRHWYDKIRDIEKDMSQYGADAFVITMLDENAWTLNLRGSDIPYNPVFRSYIIIDKSGESPSRVSLFVPDISTKVPDDVKDALGVDNCVPSQPCVSLVPYDSIEVELPKLAARSDVSKVMIANQFSTSPGASYFIYNLIPDKKRIQKPSPPLLMKAKKNQVESNGMKNAHLRDAVALISFLAFFEKEIESDAYWTELSAAEVLAGYRYDQEDNMGLSFDTISSFGPHGAIIHYSPTIETDAQITNQSLYLLDSGGQYKDGTTDVTRTLHYGTPDAEQIEAYTRVLMGVIDFATVIFPKEMNKNNADILARQNLYSAGLDYRHGTSHGIGMFLNVHEASDIGFELGFHGSDEPGFYKDGAWGVRIENVIAVENVTTEYNFVPESFKMETITLVPLEPKLINVNLLSTTECEYVNVFNHRIRTIVGPELQRQYRSDAYDWMMSKTENFTCH